MAKGKRPMPVSEDNQVAGEGQVTAEALGVLVMRSGTASISITAQERSELYAMFPAGYGLLVTCEDGGAIKVSLIDAARENRLDEFIAQMKAGEMPDFETIYRPGRGS